MRVLTGMSFFLFFQNVYHVEIPVTRDQTTRFYFIFCSGGNDTKKLNASESEVKKSAYKKRKKRVVAIKTHKLKEVGVETEIKRIAIWKV